MPQPTAHPARPRWPGIFLLLAAILLAAPSGGAHRDREQPDALIRSYRICVGVGGKACEENASGSGKRYRCGYAVSRMHLVGFSQHRMQR
jgi:hypothetical protein